MKITKALRTEAAALVRLGFTRTDAARMAVSGAINRSRLSKGLPPIDRPLPTPPDRQPGKWQTRTDRLNEQQSNRPTEEQKIKGKRNVVLKLKPRREGDDRPASPSSWIVQKRNGDQWLYQVSASGTITSRQLDKYHTNVFIETDPKAKDTEQDKQDKTEPAKSADDKKESTTMQKAQKTIERWGRNRNFNDIKESVAGVTLPEQPLQKASGTFGKTALEEVMHSQKHNSLTGHQQAALRCGLPVDHPGIENMTVDDMRRAAEQLRLDVANTERAKSGLPPLALDEPATGVSASWSQM